MIFNLSQTSPIPRIGIIGSGFSGTLVLANLVARSKTPLHIDLFEQDSTQATGIAYSTDEVKHLLNVPAAKMGAFPDKPDDFYNWLQTESGKEAASNIIPG